MEKRIEYQGMTSQPSDYVCSDGDMKLAVNAEYRDGGWKAVKEVKEIYSNKNIVFIHVLPDNLADIIIYIQDKQIKASMGEKEIDFVDGFIGCSEDENIKFCSLGKCLIAYGDCGIKVFLFRNDKYEFISDFDINLNISFCADIRSSYDNYPIATNNYNYSRTKYSYSGTTFFTDITGDNYLKTTEDLDEYGDPNEAFMEGDTASDVFFATLNKQISKYRDIHLFLYPRLIQYAIRLYDGSLIKMSPRILLYPIEDPVFLGQCNYAGGFESRMYYPVTRIDGSWDDRNGYVYNLKYLHLFFNTYKIMALAEIEENDEKKIKKLFENNIIKSVDIFMSNNIVPHRNKYIYAIKQERTISGFGYLPFLPKKKRSELKQEIDAMPLHLVRSLNFEELSTLKKNVDLLEPVSNDVLANIEQQETLEYSSGSIDNFFSRHIAKYNSRCFLCNFSKELPSISNLNIMSPSILFNSKYSYEIDTGNDNFLYAFPDVYDKNEGRGLYNYYNNIIGEAVESCGTFETSCCVKSFLKEQKFLIPLYFNTLSPNSLRGTFLLKTKEDAFFKRHLESSDFRDQLFYLDFNANDSSFENTNSFPTNSNSSFRTNAIMFSEPNNPIVYKTANCIYCGNGEILFVESNSLATSQGQFGQYPLYAFCTDGVYSIGIGTDGTLQNCVPLSYDILTDKHSVGKMEQIVVFATREGIIALSGSERKVLLSADKEADYTYDNEKQKDFITKTVNKVVGITPPQMTDLYTYITTGVRFAFDANHGRLIAFNPAYDYSYIMDAKTNNWSVFYKGFDSVLNIPEQCLLVRKETNDDGETEYNVYDYSSDEVVDIQKSYFITRPFKLDMPDVHKSIQSIIQRGVFCNRKDVQQALYGSNDLYNWTPVWSSKDIYLRGMRGSGYKYYKLAIFIPEFNQDEILHGCSVEFTPRLTNKPR